MSQEYSSRRQRRSNRTRGSRPVLVTPSATSTVENEESSVATGTKGIDSAENTNNVSAAKVESRTVPTPTPTGQRRLPRFFSNVSKSEQVTQTTAEREQTAAQARIARATRGRTATVPAVKATDSEVSEEKSGEKTSRTVPAKSTAQQTTRPATSRPAQTGFFKTRYIIGLGIYLIVADFVGVYEANLLTEFGWERQLATFNLFGLPIQVRTSTLVFLLTLIVVLVVLAYFDLLPRSLGAASRTGGARHSGSTSSGTPTERTPQPTIRQGIKGSDDDLYQAYRSNQRRSRKR